MYETLLMSRCEGRGNLSRDAQRCWCIERSVSCDVILQGIAVNVLHYEKRDGTARFNMVDGDNIFMNDCRDSLPFPSKASASRTVRGKQGGKHFDSHHAIQLIVFSLQDDACSTAPMILRIW